MNVKLIGKAINLVAAVSPGRAQKISFKLFTSPRPRKMKPAESEFLAQANKAAIEVNGDKVQIYQWGTAGPKILFAHGWESNAGRWRSFIPPLVERGYRVIAFDAPGHGASEGERLHLMIFMNAIQAIKEKYGPFEVMAGHSMGAGALVLNLEEQGLPHPKKLILMGCFSEVSNIYGSFEELLGLAPKLRKEFNKTIKTLSGKEVADFSIATKVKSLPNIKGLVIHDKQDKTIDYQEARTIAKYWQGARYVETDGAGHSLQSEEIFQEVAAFVG